MKYIQNNHRMSLKLSGVADAFLISPNHLSKIIKRATGRTFTQYLNDVRLAQARKMLCDPRIRVNEVASAVGYNDYAYFYQVFRKNEQMSPQTFRNTQRR